jgi:murein L,D-transpeptidase YcbB/YkuD
MSSVTQLPGVAQNEAIDAGANQKIVEQLEKRLEEAKRGDLVAIQYVCLHNDGAFSAASYGRAAADYQRMNGLAIDGIIRGYMVDQGHEAG